MKPAIIIIDMQNDFFEQEPLKSQRSKLVKNINQLLKSVRVKQMPIIWVYQEYKADGSDVPLHDKKTDEAFTEDDLILLENLAGQTAIAIENSRLNEDIEKTYIETITALALAVEAKDHYSRGHCKRVLFHRQRDWK